MTGNVSWFVRLIVKERISRNPMRVWSLIVREWLTLSKGFCMNLWIWNECVKLKMMKTMFWLKIATYLKSLPCAWLIYPLHPFWAESMIVWWNLEPVQFISFYLILGCKRVSFIKGNFGSKQIFPILEELWGESLKL